MKDKETKLDMESVNFSPISLTGVAFINFVSIFRCSSSAHNGVHPRRVDSSTLVFSLSVNDLFT